MTPLIPGETASEAPGTDEHSSGEVLSPMATEEPAPAVELAKSEPGKAMGFKWVLATTAVTHGQKSND